MMLSTQKDSEGQQNPYLASFCYSQALHPMFLLARNSIKSSLTSGPNLFSKAHGVLYAKIKL